MPPAPKKDLAVFYEYEKTSTLVLVVFVLFEVLVGAFALLKGINLTVMVMTACLIVAFLASYRYYVVVYREVIEITYGMGFHTQRIPTKTVEAFYIVSNNSLFARLYQPFASLILEISLKNGRKILVPVPDTKPVMEALNRVRYVKA